MATVNARREYLSSWQMQDQERTTDVKSVVLAWHIGGEFGKSTTTRTQSTAQMHSTSIPRMTKHNRLGRSETSSSHFCYPLYSSFTPPSTRPPPSSSSPAPPYARQYPPPTENTPPADPNALDSPLSPPDNATHTSASDIIPSLFPKPEYS